MDDITLMKVHNCTEDLAHQVGGLALRKSYLPADPANRQAISQIISVIFYDTMSLFPCAYKKLPEQVREPLMASNTSGLQHGYEKCCTWKEARLLEQSPAP